MEQSSHGYLTMTVRTAGGALPVEGATVTVISMDGEQTGKVTVLKTDAGGVTPSCPLPAPPKARGLKQGGGIPYACYNIETYKEGYYRVRNLMVPIYAEVTAVQGVNLLPLSADVSPDTYPSELVQYNESTPPDL